MQIKVQAAEDATPLTKRRIEYFGPVFILKSHRWLFGNLEYLLEATNETYWFGWIPEKEIKIINEGNVDTNIQFRKGIS